MGRRAKDKPMAGPEPRCSVCKHPRMDDIHMDLLAGYTAAAVGMRYGLSHDSVGRHHKNHMMELLTGSESLVIMLRDIQDIPAHMKGRTELLDQLILHSLGPMFWERNEQGLVAHTHVDRKGNVHTIHVNPIDLIPQQFVIQLFRLQQQDEHTILKLTGQLTDDGKRTSDVLDNDELLALRAHMEQYVYRIAQGDREQTSQMQIELAQQLLQAPQPAQPTQPPTSTQHGTSHGQAPTTWNGWGNED